MSQTKLKELRDDVVADQLAPRKVAAEFHRLITDGVEICPAGTAKSDPLQLLRLGYRPRVRFRLFNVDVYVAALGQNEDLRFFVAYVHDRSQPARIFPRLFYKDVSLTWRCASHYVPDANWIGKGDVKVVMSAGVEQVESDEATTDLPLEMHSALENAARQQASVRYDRRAIGMVLRNAPPGRIEPYADFARPRARALAERKELVNGGRPIARFTRRNDPTSLRITRGFEPDFHAGILSHTTLTSRLYGGKLNRFRIASTNRAAQYQFVSAPRHAWIASVQATTTTLSSYALRVVDAVVDEALLLPGYEYHYLDDEDDPDSLYSQIPPGFAGAPSKIDPSRADAAAWLGKVRLLRDFRQHIRRKTLGNYRPGTGNR